MSFERVNSWLKVNGSGVATVVAGLFLVVAVGCGGIDLKRMISVDVPIEIQKGLTIPNRTTLDDADRHFKNWMSAGEQFAENIEGGYEFLGAIEGLFSLAFSAGASALPGVGGLILTFLGGLMIQGPGSGRAKIKSYNKGRADMEKVLSELRAAGVPIPVATEVT